MIAFARSTVAHTALLALGGWSIWAQSVYRAPQSFITIALAMLTVAVSGLSLVVWLAGAYQLVGHQEIRAEGPFLEAFLVRLREFRVRLPPFSTPAFAVADGTRLELAMSPSPSAVVRVSWQESYAPAEWERFERVVLEMFGAFGGLPARVGGM